ncbi:MAG: pilus assembly protein MshP [Desulfuromonas sp.]|nr:pilus assembly protein MshP [Desulfuromonas sp.]
MPLNNQKGFTLVQAIFILVVLALLGTYMVRLSTVQQSTTTQALMQARAYQAARAGLEWGIVYTPKSTTDGNVEVFPSFSVDGTGCNVEVMITTAEYLEGTPETKYIHHIESIASSSNLTLESPDYVSHTLEVTIHE